MKRLFLILLLAVLPLQISWAAVAAYCQHEEAPSAQHFGHHTHQHQASAEMPDDTDPTKAHNDCGVCQLSGSMKSTLVQPAQIILPQSSIFIEFRPFLYSSLILDGPERPKRQLAIS